MATNITELTFRARNEYSFFPNTAPQRILNFYFRAIIQKAQYD